MPAKKNHRADSALAVEALARRIQPVRGLRVMLDSDLAALYGVETRRLNEQVRRNRERFPEDFIFELTAEEFAHLKSQSATSSWGGRRKLPLAFTEHGAAQRLSANSRISRAYSAVSAASENTPSTPSRKWRRYSLTGSPITS